MITIPVSLARELAAGFRTLKIRKAGPPALRCLHVSVSAGHLDIRATTLDESLVHSSPTPSADTAAFLLPVERISEAAKSGDPKGEISISRTEVTYPVGGQAVTHPSSGIPASEFPDAVKFNSPAQALPAGFIRTLTEALASASTDASRFILNSVFISPTDVVATDGRQMYAGNSLSLDLPKPGVIVPSTSALRVFDPAAAAEMLINAPESPTHIAFRQGAWTWAAKLIDGNYPNWKQVMPKEETMPTRIVFSDGDATRLQRVLPRLPGANEENAVVVLSVAASGAELSAGTGSSVVKVGLTDSTHSGPAVTHAFNRGYLVRALGHGFRTLLVRDGCSPALMRDGSRVHLWMPVRQDVKAAEAKPAPETPPDTKPVVPATETTAAPVAARSDVVAPIDGLQRARELLRDAVGALSEVASHVRELEREKRGAERELDGLKKSLRALKTVEV